MADIITIANGVVSELSSYNAELSFSPDFELKDLNTQRCVVVPVSIDYKNISRGQIENLYQIEVALLYRNKNLNINTLIARSASIATSMLRKKISNAVCVEVTHEPFYAPDFLRERNQFTSVIVLKFKEIVNG